jgi:hypothetical protein
MNPFADTSKLLEHLRTTREPFTVRRGDNAPRCTDLNAHIHAYKEDPALYALSAIARGVQDHQRARVLYILLSQSRTALPAGVQQAIKRVSAILLTSLPPELILSVFIALRRARANHKHTTKAIATWIIDHPHAAALIDHKPSALRDTLEHALGRDVARACAKYAATEDAAGKTYLRKHLLKFATDQQAARQLIQGLYETSKRRGKPKPIPLVRPLDPPAAARARTVTTTTRGEIAATLVQIYRQDNSQLRDQLETQLESATADLPRFGGSAVVVLDASGSMRGYGEREFAFISQSYALALLLRKCCKRLRTITIGGAGDPPVPRGDTDLANALLDAVTRDPDLVAVISDGYENVAAGDFSRVAASLEKAGVTSSIVLCQCKFTDQDDLMLRRPVTSRPTLEFWHQNDFPELLWSLFNQARGQNPRDFLRHGLLDRLVRLEKERKPWITL